MGNDFSRLPFCFLAALLFTLGLGWSSPVSQVWAQLQGQLETPQPGSFQSGIGLIRGWVCSASRVDVEVIGRGGLPAVYGEEREDTRSTCGDSNNGFSLQFNWNDLGEGSHTVRALADGQEFGRATISVATLGQTFFQGAQGEFPVEPFPRAGRTSRVRWLESRQQFVLSNGGTPATGGSSLRADAKLEDPQPGSFQSGIGVIRGWVCSASRVDIEVLGRGTIVTVYGQPRGDTTTTCGDNNNGFSAQVNWNDLGDGDYTVRALADGVEFGRATFTVVTLGLGSFPRGLTGDFVLADFPRQSMSTSVAWQESQQNFVVTGARYQGIDAGLCITQQGQAVDNAGERAILTWSNPCLLSGNLAVLNVQVPNRTALMEAVARHGQRAASTGRFFLCGTSVSIQQGGQTFGAGSFRLLDSDGNDVCREVLAGTAVMVQLQVDASSQLNLNAPFAVQYNNEEVVEFQASGPPSGAVLTVAPEQVVFDTLATGSSQDRTFRITNTGSEVLAGGLTLIANGSGVGVFTLLSEDTVSVAPGQSQDVSVRYSAISSEVFTGSVRLSTNGGVATVVLQGQGQTPPQLQVQPASVNFGTIKLQEGAHALFTVSNQGGDTLQGSVTTSIPFSIVGGSSFSLTAGQSQAVTVRVTATTEGAVKGTATVTSNGGTATVALSAMVETPEINCSYTISPTANMAVLAAGETGSVSVSTTPASGCSWTAVSNVPWITITSGSSNTGTGVVSYTVAANPDTGARTGTLTIAGQTVTVTQAEAICSYTITPTSQPFASDGGTGGVTVTTTPTSECSWMAVSNVPWIMITSGGSGSGPGTMSYTVVANPARTSRTGTLTIAGQTFTVTQQGAECLATLAPPSQDFLATGGTNSVRVTIPSECSWTATSSVPWITITSGSNGSGSGTVDYTVAANTSTGSRTGTLTIAGQTFTVTQAESGPQLSVSSTEIAVLAPQCRGDNVYFDVINIGGGTLTGSVTTSPPFRIGMGATFNLEAGDRQQVRVDYIATSLTPVDGMVQITSNAGSGSVRLYTDPGSRPVWFTLPLIDFDSVLVGSFTEQSFPQVQNCGLGTLTGSVSADPPFSITSGTTFHLQAGEVHNVTARFSPTSVGSVNGVLRGTFDGHGTFDLRDLRGQGVNPPQLEPPQQLSPPDGAVFSHFPRTTTLQWSTVPGAVSYRVNVECLHCCQIEQWCPWVAAEVTTTSYTFDWVGAQPGRWQVWAINASGQEGPRTDYWTFEYLR